MNAAFKRYIIAIATLVAVLLLAEYILNYSLGYFLIPSGADLPVVYIPWCVLLLKALLIVYIIKNGGHQWTTALFVGWLVLVSFDFTPIRPSYAIIYGLKSKIMAQNSMEGLRAFARDVDQLPPPKDVPPGLGKVYMARDLASIKGQFRDKYPFLKDSRPSAIVERNGIVTIWWGRRQWGLSVAINGTEISQGRLGPDILFVLPVDRDILFCQAAGP